MDFCERYSFVAWARNPETRGQVLFTRLRCKQWSCEYCAKKNQSIWRAFLYERLFQVSDNWWFMTLTAHSRMRSTEASYKNLAHGIDVLMKRVRRVFGKVEYVRVYEKHPTSQALHAHLLISGLSPFVVPGCNRNLQSCFLPVLVRQGHTGVWAVRTWLKKAAQECQIGYQAQVEAVENNYSVHYVTKYLSKACQQIDVKGLRHVQTSRGIGSPETASLLSWKVGSYITARDFEAGESVLDLQTGEALPDEYWSGFDHYPPEMN
jgi:hypothetical protein